MFGTKRVALLAAAMVAGGMLSFSGAPAGAQALRLGLVNADAQRSAAEADSVQHRGGGGYRGGGGFRGPGRVGPVGGARFAGPRYGGARFVAPRYGGARYMAPRYGGARYMAPRYGGARYVGPRVGGPRYVAGYPGWRPGWGHPGWRPPPGAWGPGAWRPGWGWYRPGWGWGYYNNTGAWVALGVASGLALGAVAATAEPVYGDDAVAYCMQRYRSYNPATGTYTGYDGYQHPCP